MSARALAILSFAVLPRLALAQAPAVTFDKGVTEVLFESPGIFDFSRHYTSADADGVALTIDVAHDADGHLRGTTTTVGGGVDIRGRITGRVRTVRGTTVVTEKEKSSGTTTGGPTDFRSVATSIGRVAGSGGGAALVSELSTTVCLRIRGEKKLKTICNKSTLKHESDLAHVGDWGVRLSFDANGTGIDGTGAIIVGVHTPTPRTFDVHVGGRSDPDTGEATLVLEPLAAEGPDRVTIRGIVVPNSDSDRLHVVHEVKGRILGQKFGEAY